MIDAVGRNARVWDPAQYLKFADLRLRPALELLARVPTDAPDRITDLGCGAGNVTKHIKTRWPGADITGIDGSAEMLQKAKESDPKITWRQANISAWQPDTAPDIIYSNAALHWLDDHEILFPRLLQLLPKDGVLAVQMPRNFEEPSHRVMQETAADPRWNAHVRQLAEKPIPVHAPAYYYDLLAPLAARLDIWEVIYQQILEGQDAVAEFTKGTALRPYLEALPDDDSRAAFETRYREILRAAYPQRPDGKTLFPFKRLFIVAVMG